MPLLKRLLPILLLLALFCGPTVKTFAGTTDFGSRPTTGWQERTIPFVVTGQQSWGSVTARISVGDTDFAITEDNATGRVLQPGQQFTMRVRFAPSTLGSRNGTLRIGYVRSDGFQTSVTETLQGTGIAEETFDFGTQPLKGWSEQVFKNSIGGTGAQQYVRYGLVSGDLADFYVTDNGHEGKSFSPGATASSRIRFAPAQTGQRSVVLRVQWSQGPDSARTTLRLKGTGATQPVFDLGTFAIGIPTTIFPSTTNTDTAPYTITQYDLAPSLSPDFVLTENLHQGATLQPGQQVVSKLRIQPMGGVVREGIQRTLLTYPGSGGTLYREQILRVRGTHSRIQIEALQIPSPFTGALPSIRPRDGSNDFLSEGNRVDRYPLQIAVKTPGGAPVSNARVRLRIFGHSAHAGHVPEKHYGIGGALHGWLVLPTEEAVDDDGLPLIPGYAVPLKARGGSNKPSGNAANADLVLTTDANGGATVTYIPSEIAGVDTIQATLLAADGSDTETQYSVQIPVRTEGLVEMLPDAGGGYKLLGETAAHPRNHWGTPVTVAKLKRIAVRFQTYQTEDTTDGAQLTLRTRLLQKITELAKIDLQEQGGPAGRRVRTSGYFDLPEGQRKASKEPVPLLIEDISLSQGGLFDAIRATDAAQGVPADYAAPHATHRSGFKADIRTTDLLTRLVISNGNVDTAPKYAVGHPNSVPRGSRQLNARIDGLVREINSLRAGLLVLAIRQETGYINHEGANTHFHVELFQ